MTPSKPFQAISFIIFFLCTIFCTSNLSFSQSSSNQTEAQSADTDSKWSLQFQIDENFRMTSFHGSTISLSRKLNFNKDIRFGLSLDGALSVNKLDSKRTGRVSDELDHHISVQLNCLYLITQKSFKRLAPYWGFGPDVQYSYQYKQPVEQHILSGGSSRTKIHFTEAGIGILGIFGVQLAITEDIDILAEYGSLLAYHFSKESTRTDQNQGDGDYHEMNYTERNSHSIKIMHQNVRFGVSFKF